MEKSFIGLWLLMLALNIIAPSQAKVLNIACGAARSFIDASGNQWVADDQYIRSGIPKAWVQPPNQGTFRYFPDGSTNCYKIPWGTPGARVTVTAAFRYGNYVNWRLPPSFNLQIGGQWEDVQTQVDQTVQITKPYWAVDGIVSVCLAPNRFRYAPFISAITIFEAEAGSSTPDHNSDNSGSSTGLSVNMGAKDKLGAKSKLGAKGKLGALIYLVTLFPGGTIVAVVIILFVIWNKQKKKKIEAEVSLGAGVQKHQQPDDARSDSSEVHLVA